MEEIVILILWVKVTRGKTETNFLGQKVRYLNLLDATNPDLATLRDQWRFAIRQSNRWYSYAWSTAILPGVSFFALGWLIKGFNPLPSFHDKPLEPPSSLANEAKEACFILGFGFLGMLVLTFEATFDGFLSNLDIMSMFVFESKKWWVWVHICLFGNCS